MQKVLKIAVVLLVAGSSDARPQTNGADSTHAQLGTSDAGWRGVLNKSHDTVRDNSSDGQPNVTSHRDLKDLQYMDQSLRTVATQLLNVTDPQDVVRKAVAVKEYAKPESSKLADKPSDALIREVNSEISNLESMGVSFGRPINSKFSYFETSHPGQAMAMTEEELEREMSTTRLMTAYKNHPTTSGGISTWILLNPPSTTAKSADAHDRTKLKQPFQTEVRLTVRPNKVDAMADEKTTMAQMAPIFTADKVVSIVTKKPTTSASKKVATTSARPTTDKSAPESTSSATTLKMIRVTTMSTSPSDVATASSPSPSTKTVATTVATTTTTTTKKTQGTRATSKSKVTTPRTTKPTRASRPKPTATRRTTVKLETVRNETGTSTGKIEKVTFKPVHIITTTTQRTDKPMFVTRIKASVLMDGQKVNSPTTPTSSGSSTSKPTNLSDADIVEVPVRSRPITKVKKPGEDGEPMRVNAPVLKIQKVDRDKLDEIVKEDTDELNNSRIDLKFDFNPELTKINVETEPASSTTTTAASSTTTTTKRPRHNSKRKKNKGRRRKPSTTTTTMMTSTTVATPGLTEVSDEGALVAAEDAIQESKILPETKVAPNATRIKKKQPPKAISTQIYNFLSREVMPSFGVMSLVGLGLGLASYFLYPFGGTITRRNYDTEPNYKYNLDEYGGSYGQSEEEVLSKVLQGMTTSHASAAKNHAADYYRYQHYDGAYDAHTTKRMDQARYPSTSPIYRPDNAQQAVKYRNTRYPQDAHATTPVHLAELAASANRQFVVGSVPKEYPYELPSVHGGNKAVVAYGHQRTVEASTVGGPSADDGYDEEMEITPTAVAVEHGPRALRVKRAAVDDEHGPRQPSGGQRESVIQVIPSKRELEQERKELEEEEDLSNEILDIIDSALPGGQRKPAKDAIGNEVEDLEGQEKRRREEANTRIKQSTMTETSVDAMTSTTKVDAHTTSSPKDATTVESTTESTTTNDRPAETFSLFDFVKKVAEIKFRLGLTILKHASESFARYLGHVQKRINGDE